VIADVLALLAAVAFPVVVAGLVLLAWEHGARRDARRARRRRGGRHRRWWQVVT
jgi:hypothetical protein